MLLGVIGTRNCFPLGLLLACSAVALPRDLRLLPPAHNILAVDVKLSMYTCHSQSLYRPPLPSCPPPKTHNLPAHTLLHINSLHCGMNPVCVVGIDSFDDVVDNTTFPAFGIIPQQADWLLFHLRFLSAALLLCFGRNCRDHSFVFPTSAHHFCLGLAAIWCTFKCWLHESGQPTVYLQISFQIFELALEWFPLTHTMVSDGGSSLVTWVKRGAGLQINSNVFFTIQFYHLREISHIYVCVFFPPPSVSYDRFCIMKHKGGQSKLPFICITYMGSVTAWSLGLGPDFFLQANRISSREKAPRPCEIWIHIFKWDNSLERALLFGLNLV